MSSEISLSPARPLFIALALLAGLSSAKADQSARDMGEGVPACNSVCRSWMGLGDEAAQPQPKVPQPPRPTPQAATPPIDPLPPPVRVTSQTKASAAKQAAQKAVSLPVSAALGTAVPPKTVPARGVLRHAARDSGALRRVPSVQALSPIPSSGGAVSGTGAARPPFAASAQVPIPPQPIQPAAGADPARDTATLDRPNPQPAAPPQAIQPAANADPAGDATSAALPKEVLAAPVPAPAQAIAAAPSVDQARATTIDVPEPPPAPPIEGPMPSQDMVAAPSAGATASAPEPAALTPAEPAAQVASRTEAESSAVAPQEPVLLPPSAGPPIMDEPRQDATKVSLVAAFYIALMMIVVSLFRTPAASRRGWDNERLTLPGETAARQAQPRLGRSSLKALAQSTASG